MTGSSERIQVDEIIMSELRRAQRRHSRVLGEYWPSQIYSCLRKQYYSFYGDEVFGDDALRNFEAGNAYHDLIARTLQKWGNTTGARVQTEVPIRIPHRDHPEIVFSGRADDIILIEKERRRFILEVKTTTNLVQKLRDNNIPRREHLAQLNLYLRAYPYSSGILMYVDRATLKTHQFDLEFEQHIYDETMKRVAALHNYLKESRLPPPEAKESGSVWMCRYCSFLGLCSNNQNPGARP